METNEQTELTSKIETDLWMETAKWGEAKGWRDRAKRKRTHGHGQQCGDSGRAGCKGTKW